MYYRGAQAAIIVYDCTSNVRNGHGPKGQGPSAKRQGAVQGGKGWGQGKGER